MHLKAEIRAIKAIIKERDKRYKQLNHSNQTALNAAWESAKDSRDALKSQNDKWQANANEWREALNDRDRNFVTKNALWGICVAMLSLSIAFATLIVRVFGGY